MGPYLSVPILAVVAALQSSLIPQVRLLSGQPDLVVLLVLAWSVHASLEEGLVWAFVGGIMQDLLSLTPTGTSVAGMVIMVFIMYGVRQQIYRINILFVAVFLLTGTFLQQLIVYVVHLIIGLGGTPAEIIQYVLLPALLYNLLLMLPVYAFVRVIQRSIYPTRVR